MKYEETSRQVIKAFLNVYHALGYGFLENVYGHALQVELRDLGIPNIPQYPIHVLYKGEDVGNYFADFAINDQILVEIKAVRTVLPEHEAQLLNYLNATKYEVGLLLNFGIKPDIIRKVFDNERKKYISADNGES